MTENRHRETCFIPNRQYQNKHETFKIKQKTKLFLRNKIKQELNITNLAANCLEDSIKR